MKAQEMSALFDIDIEDNLSASEDNEIAAASFSDRCSDIQSVMGTEVTTQPIPPTIVEKNIIEKNIIEKNVPDNDIDLEIPNDNSDEVDKDIASFGVGTVTVVEEKINDTSVPSDNPLNLSGQDLKAYSKIKSDWPQFNLYDGSLAFKDFYRHKVAYLKILLGKYPLHDIQDMIKELKEIPLDHVVDGDVADPSLIQRKIGDTQRCRVRVGSLLIDVLAQHSLWERFVDILRAKLYKDHEVKGQHKKDAVLIEHLSDMEQYLGELKGFLDIAEHSDSLLRAAAESLSRQLTCLQVKESLALSPMKERIIPNRSVTQSNLDNLDTLSVGTVISAPKVTNAVSKVNYGNDDDISSLGV